MTLLKQGPREILRLQQGIRCRRRGTASNEHFPAREGLLNARPIEPGQSQNYPSIAPDQISLFIRHHEPCRRSRTRRSVEAEQAPLPASSRFISSATSVCLGNCAAPPLPQLTSCTRIIDGVLLRPRSPALNFAIGTYQFFGRQL